MVTGCDLLPKSVVVERHTEHVFEPEVYQHCPTKEPVVPAEGATLAQWHDYVTDLRAWGRGCEATVEGGSTWQERQRQKLAEEDQSN